MLRETGCRSQVTSLGLGHRRGGEPAGRPPRGAHSPPGGSGGGEQVALIRRPPAPRAPLPPALPTGLPQPSCGHCGAGLPGARPLPGPLRVRPGSATAASTLPPAVWAPLRRRSGRLPAAPGGRAGPCAPRAPSRRPRAPRGRPSARPAPPRAPAPAAPGGCGRRLRGKAARAKLLQLRLACDHPPTPAPPPLHPHSALAQRRPRPPRGAEVSAPAGLEGTC